MVGCSKFICMEFSMEEQEVMTMMMMNTLSTAMTHHKTSGPLYHSSLTVIATSELIR